MGPGLSSAAWMTGGRTRFLWGTCTWCRRRAGMPGASFRLDAGSPPSLVPSGKHLLSADAFGIFVRCQECVWGAWDRVVRLSTWKVIVLHN